MSQSSTLSLLLYVAQTEDSSLTASPFNMADSSSNIHTYLPTYIPPPLPTQRITIARAVVRNPRLLIFHESINQLDTESEQAIQVAIDNLIPNRTVIIIAHRMSTIRKAHSIAVFHDGRICQVGR